MIEKIDLASWEEVLSDEAKLKAVTALEAGKVLYFPHLPFILSKEESKFLDPGKVDPKRKNISYDLKSDHLGGSLWEEPEAGNVKAMMRRYATCARHFLESLIPGYKGHFEQARTSFRAVEIAGRKNSVHKDDTRLHIDAFPSTPTKGNRILRIFSNINEEGKPRVWRVGEPFDAVVNRFAGKVSRPWPLMPHIMRMFGITKGVRTSYDHYMLNIHDRMKEDDNYQKNVSYDEILFPPNTSWMVYTDQVSHAALSGQHVLEQTFYLPVSALKTPKTAPLSVLEGYFEKALI